MTTNYLGEEQVDKLELVLKEVLDEQQKINNMNARILEQTEELTSLIKSMEERLENGVKNNPHFDATSLEATIKNDFNNLELLINNQPKNVVRKFQILLFPERDANLFYKIVFGRFFLLLMMILLITCLFKWGIHRSDLQKEIQLEELHKERLQKAWDFLYRSKRKITQHLMDSIYKEVK